MKKKEKCIIATVKPWNIENVEKFIADNKNMEVYLITGRKELNYSKLKSIDPRYIFFPHWSWIIPENIYENFECVVFHMTDLPFGRGGSPLQNLIVRGYDKTKISAIKVVKQLDAGPVYLKRSLSLKGNAEEIYRRAAEIIFLKMIPNIMKNQLVPEKQRGKTVVFKRRKPEQSNIRKLAALKQVYDHIRMLDAEGYPKAFLETEELKLKFSKAVFKKGKLKAEVDFEVKK
ncbi:methionyl-tRNA formyltransferase [Elusimicrobiota bacterium]